MYLATYLAYCSHRIFLKRDSEPLNCPPKIGSPKICLTGPVLAETLPQLVPWTTFAAKINPAGPVLAVKRLKTGPLANFGPPVNCNFATV